MEIDLFDAVETRIPIELLWQRMVDSTAVIGVLGGDATDVQPLAADREASQAGYTFRIKGVGGGVYHARVDRSVEHVLVSYLVQSENAPESPLMLTYSIEITQGKTTLTGSVIMDMPLEEVLASFALGMGLLAMPLVGGLVRRYVAKRLRVRLLSMASHPEGDTLSSPSMSPAWRR